MNPTGYIMFWLFGFGPVLLLGLFLGGKITDWRITAHKCPPCGVAHNPRCEHRACDGCGGLYHESWNGEGEEPLCPNCSGAT